MECLGGGDCGRNIYYGPVCVVITRPGFVTVDRGDCSVITGYLDSCDFLDQAFERNVVMMNWWCVWELATWVELWQVLAQELPVFSLAFS